MMLLFGVLVLMALSRAVAVVARQKGYGGCGFIVLLWPLCIGGAMVGATVAATFAEIVGGGDSTGWAVLGFLLGGTAGATAVFVIIRFLPRVHKPAPVEDNLDGDW